MKNNAFSAIVDAHVKVQLGTYFTSVTDLPQGGKFVYSKRIDYQDWNFAYGYGAIVERPEDVIQVLKVESAKHGRLPTLFSHPSADLSGLKQFVSKTPIATEVWMGLAHKVGITVKTCKGFTMKRIGVDCDLKEFTGVLRNLGSTNAPGLPEGFPKSIEDSTITSGVDCQHFVGFLDQMPVSIASIYVIPPFAGLYNVGTVSAHRRNGFGTALSIAAINHGLTNGAELIFLQTVSDSPVETMYSKIGFRRLFLGSYYDLVE